MRTTESEKQKKQLWLYPCSYCGRLPGLAQWTRYYTFGCPRCDTHILNGFTKGRFSRRRANTLEIAADEWNYLNDLPGAKQSEVFIFD